MALSPAQITLAYQNALQRTPSASEVNSYVAVSNSGALSDAQIFSSISNSQEANTFVDPVVRFYQAAFGRVPDQAGLAQQVRTLEVPGQSLQTIASGFTQSQEFVNKYGTNGAVTEAYVQALYVNVLGRTGTGAEVNAWIQTVADPASGYKTAADVLFGFAQSGEFIQRSEGAINTFLSSAAQGTATYTGALPLPNAVDNSGSNVSLTVDPNTLTASTFNAPLLTSPLTGAQIQTLTSADNLQGSGTNASLNAVLNGTEVSTKATINGVSTINLTAVGLSTFDASNTKGAAAINSVDSTATLLVSNLGTAATIGVTNTAVGNFDQTFRFANTLASGASDTASITLNNVGRGATANTDIDINVRGESAGGFETLNVKSTGAASRIDSIVSNVGGADVGGAATAAGVGGIVGGTNFTKTLNVTGEADLRVGAALTGVTTVDASAFTGKLNIITDAGLDVKVTGGTGADTFGFAAGLTNADTVNGGDGRDTLRVSALTGLGDGNKISNVEILRFDDAVAGTFDQNKLTSVDAIVQNSTGAIVVDNFDQSASADATKGITVLNTGLVTVNVEGSAGLGATSDVLNVKYGATGVAAGSLLQTAAGVASDGLTVANVETLNLSVLADDAGQTAAGTGAITAAAATTINVTGGASGEAFSLNGGAALGVGGTLTKIDGSAFAGNLTATGNAGAQQILGGTGDDILGTGGRGTAATQGDVITTGTGNDTVVFAATDSTAAIPSGTVSGTFTGTERSLFTSVTDFNFGGATAGTTIDLVNLSAVSAGFTNAAAANVAVVNSGAVTALTGVDFATGVANVLAAGTGVLQVGANTGANTAAAGLFSFGGETFLIATDGAAAGYAAGDDIVIKVTGFTGTLDNSDFVPA